MKTEHHPKMGKETRDLVYLLLGRALHCRLYQGLLHHVRQKHNFAIPFIWILNMVRRGIYGLQVDKVWTYLNCLIWALHFQKSFLNGSRLELAKTGAYVRFERWTNMNRDAQLVFILPCSASNCQVYCPNISTRCLAVNPQHWQLYRDHSSHKLLLLLMPGFSNFPGSPKLSTCTSASGGLVSDFPPRSAVLLPVLYFPSNSLLYKL